MTLPLLVNILYQTYKLDIKPMNTLYGIYTLHVNKQKNRIFILIRIYCLYFYSDKSESTIIFKASTVSTTYLFTDDQSCRPFSIVLLTFVLFQEMVWNQHISSSNTYIINYPTDQDHVQYMEPTQDLFHKSSSKQIKECSS
jgi:hypothetical protein